MNDFRKQHPARRSGVQKRSNYRDYLPNLTIDFNYRCGYTDSSHRHWGVRFQVDHFAPLRPNVAEEKKQAFLDGELEYENLVYVCPQVNRAKWNDWPSDDPSVSILNGQGYYDPCKEDFNTHFYRTSGGGIMPKNGDEVAEYMWSQLKLFLKRYEIYWRIDLLGDKVEVLTEISHQEAGSENEVEILRLIRDFGKEIKSYEKYLNINKNAIA